MKKLGEGGRHGEDERPKRRERARRLGDGVVLEKDGKGVKRTNDRRLTYLLVASSSTSIELGLKRACARQKSCF